MSKLMRGTTNQKLTLLFETLSGGKGEIDLVDLVKFVRATTSEIQEDAEFATEVCGAQRLAASRQQCGCHTLTLLYVSCRLPWDARPRAIRS